MRPSLSDFDSDTDKDFGVVVMQIEVDPESDVDRQSETTSGTISEHGIHGYDKEVDEGESECEAETDRDSDDRTMERGLIARRTRRVLDLEKLTPEPPVQIWKDQCCTLAIVLGLALPILVGIMLLAWIFMSVVELKYDASLATRARQNWIKDTPLPLSVPGITRTEFLDRQDALCRLLKVERIDALVAEPSATTLYYANISSYELSERPFLIIFTRDCGVTYLAPKFEVGRIRDMHAITRQSVDIIEWAETESPYTALRRYSDARNVMVDDATRYMVVEGLTATGMTVRPMSLSIRSIRAIKSPDEIRILETINAFTVDVIRAVQKELKVDTPRLDLERAIKTLFDWAGVGTGFWAIVLYGSQAASPHGGNTENWRLRQGEFVLIDVGSTLHGYGSDVTRTILPTGSKPSRTLLEKWFLVHAAQSLAISRMYENNTCSSVDEASRTVIRDAGWGEYYTHRLGHGLGLEMHEYPYLNGANSEVLSIGNVVTNEPGIYVTPEQAKSLGLETGFGVRIEDAVLVTADGPRLMTGSRAKSPYEP